MTGTLAAFGAGALVAALSIELVAPVVAELHHHPASRDALLALMAGAAAGGVLFVVLDQLVNARGGFLRKTATTIGYLRSTRRERTRRILDDLSQVDLLRNVPPDEMGGLVEDLRPTLFQDGEILFREGEPGDRLFFIRRGHVDLAHGGAALAALGPGDVVGEIALVAATPRTATGRARGLVETLALSREEFDRWRGQCPELDAAARGLAQTRLSQLRDRDAERHADAERWADAAIDALRLGTEIPTAAEIRGFSEERSGAPLAIWLGILLDGIPESLVIGQGFHNRLHAAGLEGLLPGLGDLIPYTLVAGLFLSNFPEAMSSSVGMRSQGFTPGRVLFLWTTLMVATGLGAGVGYLLGESLPTTIEAGIEGLAAGAMLTMIASTMIPEAVHLGGRNTVGLATLAGFFSAVAFALVG